MKTVAACIALLLTLQCAAGAYTGFIRVSGEKFVDDNCQEFVPLGMNTYVVCHNALSITSGSLSAAWRVALVFTQVS